MIQIKSSALFIFLFFSSLLGMEKEKLLDVITGSDLVMSDDESNTYNQVDQKKNILQLPELPDVVLTNICSRLDFNDILSLRTTNKNLFEKIVNLAYPIDNLEKEIFEPIDDLPFCNGESDKQSIKNIITIVTDHVNRNANTIAKRWYEKSLQVKKTGSVAKVLYKKLCLLNRALTYKNTIDTELKQTIKTEFKTVLKQVWLCRNHISITEHKKIIQAIAHRHGLLLDASWFNTLKSLYHRVINNSAVVATLSMAAITGILYVYLTTQSLLNSPKYLITEDDGPHWKYRFPPAERPDTFIPSRLAAIRPIKVDTQYTCYDTNGNTSHYKSFYNYSPLLGAITLSSYIMLRFLKPVRQGIQKILKRCICYQPSEDRRGCNCCCCGCYFD